MGTIEAANELEAASFALLDGPKLVDILIERGIGIRKKPIELRKLDTDAFTDGAKAV